jgi:hypothetical protein
LRSNIGLNGLDGFDGIIGLAGFDLNCLDDFNGIIGLVGFGLIGCIGFIVGTIGLIMLIKLVGLVGLFVFDCIGEPAFDLNFNYRSVVGKLNYLAQTARPDIMYAMHQTAKYSSDPKTSHGEAVLYLIHYLKKTRDLGLLSSLIPTKILNATAMLTSQDCVTGHLCQWTLVPPRHEVVGSSSMQAALSLGHPNFNPKLNSTPPKLSTLQCHKL